MHIDQLCAVLGEGTQNIAYSVRNNPGLVVKIAKSNNLNMEKQSNILSTLDKTGSFPKVFCLGKMQVGMHPSTNLPVETSFLVMEKLGISLQEFMTLRQGNISVGTIRKIGLQLLQKIKILHLQNITHNDIKPANILFGLKEKRNEVFIIDFGMAEKHQEMTSNYSHSDSQIVDMVFKGNIKFSSLRKLKGNICMKLDDIEALLYLLIWMLLGGKSISQVSGLQARRDPIKQTLRQRLLFQFEFKKLFIQNAETLLPLRLSGQKLNLSLLTCNVLQHLSAEYKEQRLDFFYQSISTILQSHK